MTVDNHYVTVVQDRNQPCREDCDRSPVTVILHGAGHPGVARRDCTARSSPTFNYSAGTLLAPIPLSVFCLRELPMTLWSSGILGGEQSQS